MLSALFNNSFYHGKIQPKAHGDSGEKMHVAHAGFTKGSVYDGGSGLHGCETYIVASGAQRDKECGKVLVTTEVSFTTCPAHEVEVEVGAGTPNGRHKGNGNRNELAFITVPDGYEPLLVSDYCETLRLNVWDTKL